MVCVGITLHRRFCGGRTLLSFMGRARDAAEDLSPRIADPTRRTA